MGVLTASGLFVLSIIISVIVLFLMITNKFKLPSFGLKKMLFPDLFFKF